jgi:arylsulfatase A-like enzyme
MRVLVITVAGLRPDYLGCYGSDWVETPALDRLAAEAVVFDQHFAARPDLPGASRDLQSLLRQPDIPIWLVADATGAVPDESVTAKHKVIRIQKSEGKRILMESTVDAALKAVRRLSSREDAFLWISLPGLVPPWRIADEFLEAYFTDAADKDGEPGEQPLEPWLDPPPGLLTHHDERTILRLSQTYAAAVCQVDAAVAVLLEALDEEEKNGGWLLALTAPFGLPLGEHGVVGDARPWLHNERLHVPLLFRLPGRPEAGRRVQSLTQTADLSATLLDALHLPWDQTAGHSLLSLCRGPADLPRSKIMARWETETGEDRALITPNWKFILPVRAPASDPTRGPQLYARPDDPWEVNNVVQHHLELAEEMEGRLRAMVDEDSPGPGN